MKYLKDWKVHALCFVMVIVSELIGKHSFSFGPVGFTLFPMLYALIIGIILAQFKLIDREMMATASPYITISVMYLTAKMASSIGPNLEAVLNAGPALILQEFGNLGTIFLALPIAVCVFKMGRAAVGASFSTSRELHRHRRQPVWSGLPRGPGRYGRLHHRYPAGHHLQRSDG